MKRMCPFEAERGGRRREEVEVKEEERRVNLSHFGAVVGCGMAVVEGGYFKVSFMPPKC